MIYGWRLETAEVIKKKRLYSEVCTEFFFIYNFLVSGDRCEIDEDNRGSLNCMFDDNRGTAIDLVKLVSNFTCLYTVLDRTQFRNFSLLFANSKLDFLTAQGSLVAFE